MIKLNLFFKSKGLIARFLVHYSGCEFKLYCKRHATYEFNYLQLSKLFLFIKRSGQKCRLSTKDMVDFISKS